MDQPSRQLADRYLLQLDTAWQRWFDRDAPRVAPAGMMRDVLSPEELCAAAPPQIWPGFMLPDTLPIVGNEYGDWLCVRVLPSGDLGELVYWYHGGGDWIPVGTRIAEALLHDAVDQFRSLRPQMLRGAFESRDEDNAEVLARLEQPAFVEWLRAQLVDDRCSLADIGRLLTLVIDALCSGQHARALELLYQNGWARAAAACDLIEHALQQPLQPIAGSEVAEAAGIGWYPDYVSLLFDTARMSPEQATSVRAAASLSDDAWPRQDWEVAQEIADQVIADRSDLGWAYTIAGWARQRTGDFAQAASIYWDGRYASSFADQSVRLNSHCLADKTGKFAVERLLELQDALSSEAKQDDYLRLMTAQSDRALMTEVHEYWWQQGELQRERHDYAAAYDCFYRSGWDLGISRLSDYGRILQALAQCARAADWQARALVAETHLACLEDRTGR